MPELGIDESIEPELGIDGSIERELGFGFGMDTGAAGIVFVFGTGRALAITALYLKAYTLSGLSMRPDHLQYSSIASIRDTVSNCARSVE